MKFITESTKTTITARALASGGLDGQTVTVKGAVHALRKLGGIDFMTLRLRDGALQCVCGPEGLPEGLCEECTVSVTGAVRTEARAPGGRELTVESIDVLSRPAEAMPVPIDKWKLNLNLDTELGLRPVVLRNLRKRSVFKIQEGLSPVVRTHPANMVGDNPCAPNGGLSLNDNGAGVLRRRPENSSADFMTGS